MAELVVNERVRIPLSEITLAFARSGGPGGQNVNKVETQVEARWRPASSRALTPQDCAWLLQRLAPRLTNDGELIVVSSTHRTQTRNREDVLQRLADIVREALFRPKKRTKTKPSAGAKKRRLEGKKARSFTKKNRNWRGDD